MGIVLNHILQKLDKLMLERAHECHRQYLELGISSDDSQGCISVVMGYIDDINAIVHIEDAAFSCAISNVWDSRLVQSSTKRRPRS